MYTVPRVLATALGVLPCCKWEVILTVLSIENDMFEHEHHGNKDTFWTNLHILKLHRNKLIESSIWDWFAKLQVQKKKDPISVGLHTKFVSYTCAFWGHNLFVILDTHVLPMFRFHYLLDWKILPLQKSCKIHDALKHGGCTANQYHLLFETGQP